MCDNAEISSCPRRNDFGRIPVQVANISASGHVVGGTPGDYAGDYGGVIGDNLGTAQIETEAWASCMVLKNDFGWLPTSLHTLRVTAAHELVHIITNGWGDPNTQVGRVWDESIATYMEDEVFDEINQNIDPAFLWPPIEKSFAAIPNTPKKDTYKFWLLFKYIAERMGGTNIPGRGENVIQRFWERISQDEPALPAFEGAIRDVAPQASFAQLYHGFAVALRFRASCNQTVTYCFEEGAAYRNPNIHRDLPVIKDHFEVKRRGDPLVQRVNNHYAANWIALPPSNAYMVEFKNLSVDGIMTVSIAADVAIPERVEVVNLGTILGGQTRSLYYAVPQNARKITLVVSNSHTSSPEPTEANVVEHQYSVTLSHPVAFVIDDSASMQEELPAAKAGAKGAITLRQAAGRTELYHLIRFSDDMEYKGKTTDPNQARTMLDSLTAHAGGGCADDILGALELLAARAPGSSAIIMTDSSYSQGNPAATAKRVLEAGIIPTFVRYDTCTLRPQPASAPALGADPSIQDSEFALIAQRAGGQSISVAAPDIEHAVRIAAAGSATPAQLAIAQAAAIPGQPKTHGIKVDAGLSTLNILLTGRSSVPSLTLRNPAGAVVQSGGGVQSTVGTTFRHYAIQAPAAGTWTAEISGQGDYNISAAADSPLALRLTSDPTMIVGVAQPITVDLRGETVQNPVFEISRADGQGSAPLTLFDDGQHGDQAADDQIFGGTYAPSAKGRFYLHARGNIVSATGLIAFERADSRLITTQDISIQPPAAGSIRPNTSRALAFVVKNHASVPQNIFLSAASSQGWLVQQPIPSIALQPNQSTTVTLVLRLANATAGQEDMTTLVAHTGDMLESDVESTHTHISFQTYLPRLTR